MKRNMNGAMMIINLLVVVLVVVKDFVIKNYVGRDLIENISRR
jgi:hypothetical protein